MLTCGYLHCDVGQRGDVDLGHIVQLHIALSCCLRSLIDRTWQSENMFEFLAWCVTNASANVVTSMQPAHLYHEHTPKKANPWITFIKFIILPQKYWPLISRNYICSVAQLSLDPSGIMREVRSDLILWHMLLTLSHPNLSLQGKGERLWLHDWNQGWVSGFNAKVVLKDGPTGWSNW